MTAKVLIIRFSSIGDIVLTTPVIRCIKQQLDGGDVEVHFLTKSVNAQILEANPYIDRLITIDRNVSEVVDDLRSQDYDTVIDLHNNLRSMQVKRALGKPTHKVDKLTLRRLLFINLKLDMMPDSHIVDRYLDTVSSLGVNNDEQGLDYFLRAEDEVNPSAFPATHRDGYVAIVIGGQHQGKLYPVDHIVAVCEQLGSPVILLGGPEDDERAEIISQRVGPSVFNACGRFPLNQSACLVRDADCVIANDTGLMHIAAAFRKKVISLWGATVPRFGMSPYMPGPGSKVLEADCPGRPYSKHGGKALLRAPYDCWDGLEPEKVVQAVRATE